MNTLLPVRQRQFAWLNSTRKPLVPDEPERESFRVETAASATQTEPCND